MRTLTLAILLATIAAAADPFTIETNVVYGMYSGAALLLDVYKPIQPNGYGIIYVSGSGWTTPLAYNAPALKSNSQSQLYAKALATGGYTVFAVNHRSLPRFRYPAPVEDVQRAVRYIRHNAKTYGIRADRIGASGGSSGGHLVSMLGTLDGKGNPTDLDPVERESAKVQCVVARAAPVNFLTGSNGQFLLGLPRPLPEAKDTLEYRTHIEASPISHVTPDDPPFLLMHGDKDEAVNIGQSEEMEAKLKAAGIPVKFLRIAGASHGPTFPGATNPPDYLAEMVRWFNLHLLRK
jgi:acetyl esterase/lipase